MTSTAGLRILVADDNRSTAFSLGKVLEKRGHAVHVVLNGLAALDETRQFKPQVVMVDIGMPGVDGHEVTRQIRHEPGFEKTLILVISGYGRPEDLEKSRAAGADHHFLKPIDFERLWQVLDGAGSSDQPGGPSEASASP